MTSIKDTLSRLTERLDHMVPDPKLTALDNQKAAAQLAALSARLHVFLPDHTLSPQERLERLARVIQNRVPQSQHLLSANEKLAALTTRLNELVPGGMTPEEKVDHLVDLATKAVPDPNLSMVDRLEKIGDDRAGIAPVK